MIVHKSTGIAKRLFVTLLVLLLCSCNGNGAHSEIEEYINYLTVESMLSYCSTDGVYDGGGHFRISEDVDRYYIEDDGRLCEALLTINITPTALSLQRNQAKGLTDLITYSVPYDDYARVVIYDGDYLGCEVHPDLSFSYYRYYKIEDGMSETLRELAIDIRDGVDS
ncbi:MAG: hypothetical protein EOM74_00025 [Methanomicrobia archaeon]|nr:hypothetical protein [Methanomicrobia archaeon]